MAVRTSPAGGRALPGWVRTRPGPDPGTVHLTVVDPGAVTAAAARQCCDALARAGWSRAVTNAMAPADAEPLLAAGFRVDETLHLLGRALDTGPDPASDPASDPGAGRGRARPVHRVRRLEPVAALDARAFGARAFDVAALRDARDATPRARLRVVGPPTAPHGYAITGVAGWRAYVQRLAVDPGAQRRGLGRVLLRDGLCWARRRGATTALVNTHEDNDAARALYESEGFTRLPRHLVVLEHRW